MPFLYYFSIMAKRLIQMTTAEVKAEFSCAGSPDKISQLFDRVWAEIVNTVDWKNHSEHTNVMLMLARMYVEVKGSQKRLDKMHSADIANQLKQFERELKFDGNN